MRAWRICRRPYADLSGSGARAFGGRWNSPGRPLVYAAATAALAVLEVRVHLDLPLDLLPGDYVLVEIELAEMTTESLASFPADPVAFGDAWLAERRSPVLQVPSFIVPESANLLINPDHPEAAARVAGVRDFVFDERLWRPM